MPKAVRGFRQYLTIFCTVLSLNADQGELHGRSSAVHHQASAWTPMVRPEVADDPVKSPPVTRLPVAAAALAAEFQLANVANKRNSGREKAPRPARTTTGAIVTFLRFPVSPPLYFTRSRLNSTADPRCSLHWYIGRAPTDIHLSGLVAAGVSTVVFWYTKAAITD